MRFRIFAVPFVLAAFILISCDSDDQLPGGCFGNVSTASQTGNTINATGNFGEGQPIIRLTRNGVNNEIPATNYNAGTASFDIGGVAKGAYTLTWIMSCFNDEGEVVMSSSVTSITIT